MVYIRTLLIILLSSSCENVNRQKIQPASKHEEWGEKPIADVTKTKKTSFVSPKKQFLQY